MQALGSVHHCSLDLDFVSYLKDMFIERSLQYNKIHICELWVRAKNMGWDRAKEILPEKVAWL